MSGFDPAGCCALITGASAGIGREFARQLTGRARALVLVARRMERLEELRNELTKRDPNLNVLIRAAGLPFEVENAGLSGDTSAGGLRRVDWLLQRPVDVLFLELGANDGLRGQQLKSLKVNLQAIIDKTKAKNPQVKIVLAGMQVPPNLGAEYASGFQRVFTELAQENNAVLIPFLLEGVGGNRELNQQDLIHPSAAGHRIIAELVWRTLEPILRQP